jgi:DNA-binding FadR family transcriptional regulator
MASPGPASNLAWLAEHPAFRDGISKKPIAQLISEKLSALIASGVLQAGDALPSERDLAAALNVSRAAIRGGVQILATRGVLEISQGARTRVRRSDLEALLVTHGVSKGIGSYDLDAVHASRQLVESHLVADAARHITKDRLQLLQALLETQQETLDDAIRFLICDREFHVAIYQTSRNPLLADFATDLYAYMMEYRREVMARPGAIAASYADHVAIVDALRTRDPVAAAQAMAAHTGRIYRTTQSVLHRDRPDQT